MTKFKTLDQHEELKAEIKAFVAQEALKVAREIGTTVAEQVAKDVVTDRLSSLIVKEIAIYNANKLEALVVGHLKQAGAIPHLNNPSDIKSIDMFIEEYQLDDLENELDVMIDGSPTDEVYDLYCEMCQDKEIRPVHKKSFSRELNRKCGIKTVVKSIDGKSVRIYTR